MISYTLTTDKLILCLSSQSLIQGIKIGKKEFKLVQYADDTTVFLKDLKSVRNLLKILQCFEKCSGLKIKI